MNRQSSIFNRQWTSAAVIAALLACVALAQRQPAAPALGAISFPNSGAPAAQDAFLRGVAWLHSFGYEEAIDAFREAQKVDPAFALAYWGEALAFNQPLWFQEEPEKGRAALRKLGATSAERLAKAKTPREQAYLAAVEALWDAGDKRSRDLKYRRRWRASSRSSRKTMRRRRSMR